ncbi:MULTISPECIES: hypothetical protein [unclassified Pseudonocardia]|nr:MULTISPECIES: hypothetical protein [unclassified Pseudonocardia]OLL89563.1 hypothetical protein Ae331Ps2_6237 [Pseudonocardia sp. Ae331_Ps2]OLM08307.1 hypothetical protein Ae505Ps2_6211c [Pseudonocardia sp. Ae505_Ps2]OLM08310.1 hypothetical protein Ae505Ps2_6214c [Pseudonocardia sp. Ae505_Ps2]
MLAVALVVLLASLRYRHSLGHNFATATGLSLVALCFGVACQFF